MPAVAAAPFPSRPALLRWQLLALVVCMGLTAPAARAQEAPAAAAQDGSQQRLFDIPAGDLGTALTLYGEHAGLRLLTATGTTAGKKTAGVSGSYTAEQALQQLLSGTGLSWRRTDNGTVVLDAIGAADGALLLDPVRIEGSAPVSDEDRPYATAGSSSHISQQKIERFRGTSVGDIFQGTPGVLVGENRNSGGLDVNIRGMQGQGRVPVLIDGSRQETTVYRGYAGVASRSYVDPDLIGGIDIAKGPTMSAQGTGAIGGVVNMRTLAANDIIKDDKGWGLRIRGTAIGNSSSAPESGTYAGYYLDRAAYRSDCRFASYCEGWELPEHFAPETGMDRPGLLDFRSWAGSLAAAKRFERVDLVIAYAQRNQGSYYAGKNGPAPYIAFGEPLQLPWYTETPVSIEGVSRFRAGERVPNSRYESSSTLLKSVFYLPNDHELELGYIRYDSDFGEMMPSQIRGFGQAREWIPSSIVMDTYVARYRHAPAGSRWLDLRANLWHTDSGNVINTPDIYSIDVDDNTRRDEDYRRWGLDLSNTTRLPLWGGIKLDYGLAAQLEDMTSTSNGTGGFYNDPRSGDRKEFSVFTALEWKILSSLTFDAGLRYTRFHSADDNAINVNADSDFCVDPDGDGECDPIFYKNRNSGWAPIAGLTWAPLPGLQLYARYSEALRMPSLFETTSGLSVSPVMDVAINPEHAKNREIGINYLKDGLLRSEDKLRLKLAYFHNRVNDYLTRTQPNAWEAQPWLFFRMRNVDRADFHGVELSGSYDFGPVYTEFGGTRYTHIEVCNVGSYVRYPCTNYGLANSYINNMIPPNWHASLTLGTRLLQRKLDLGARGTFMGQRNNIPRYNAQTGFNSPIAWHAYNLIDVYASYRHSDTVTLDFNIDNVTDRYYLDALSLGLVPAPGRAARLSLTLQF